MSDPTAVTDEDVLKRFGANGPQEVTDQDVLSRFNAGQQSDAPLSVSGELKSIGSGAAIGASQIPGQVVGLWNLGKRAYHELNGETYDPQTQDTPVPQVFQNLEKKANDLYTPQNATERVTQDVSQYIPYVVGGPESLVADGAVAGAKVLAKRALGRVVAPTVAANAASSAAQGTALEPYAGPAAALAVGGMNIRSEAKNAAAAAKAAALEEKPLSPNGTSLHDMVADAGDSARTSGNVAADARASFKAIRKTDEYKAASPEIQSQVDDLANTKVAKSANEAGNLALLGLGEAAGHFVGAPLGMGALLARWGGRTAIDSTRARLTLNRIESLRKDIRASDPGPVAGPAGPGPTGPAIAAPPQPWPNQPQPVPAPQVQPLNPIFIKQMQAQAKAQAAAKAPAPTPAPAPAPTVAPLNPQFIQQMQAEAKARAAAAQAAPQPAPAPAPAAPAPAAAAPAPAPVAPPSAPPSVNAAPSVAAPAVAPPAPAAVPPQMAATLATKIKKANGKVTPAPAPEPTPTPQAAPVAPQPTPAPAAKVELPEDGSIPAALRRDANNQLPITAATQAAEAAKPYAPKRPFSPAVTSFEHSGKTPAEIGASAKAKALADGRPTGVAEAIGNAAQRIHERHQTEIATLKQQFPEDAPKLDFLLNQISHLKNGKEPSAAANFGRTVNAVSADMSTPAAKSAVKSVFNEEYQKSIWKNNSGKKKPKANGKAS